MGLRIQLIVCIWYGIIFHAVDLGHGITFEEDVTLSRDQRDALQTFKTKMSPKLPEQYMKEDLFLLKWLRYNNFDLKLAEHRLLNHVAWRKSNRMDTINDEDWSDMQQDFKYYLDGRDKFGRSILYFDVGSLDLRRALIQGKGDRLMRYVDMGLQQACALVRELGHEYKNITRGHLIINLNGYSMLQHGCLRCLPFLLRIVVGYEENYPECADQIITVNTPAAVEPVLNAIRPLLSQGMRNSLHIYGNNKNQWMQAMEKDFDFDKLPPALGGSQLYPGMES